MPGCLYFFYVGRLYPAFMTIGQAHLHPATIGIHDIYFSSFMNYKQSSGFINRATFYIYWIAENNGLFMVVKIA